MRTSPPTPQEAALKLRWLLANPARVVSSAIRDRYAARLAELDYEERYAA